MPDITPIEVVVALGPYATALGTGLAAYLLGTRKSKAEVGVLNGKIAQQDAETKRFVNDTKWNTILRLGERIDDLEKEEKEMEKERSLYDVRIKAKNIEIRILQEQLLAAQILTEKYRKIATLLQEQLESAGIVPQYDAKCEIHKEKK